MVIEIPHGPEHHSRTPESLACNQSAPGRVPCRFILSAKFGSAMFNSCEIFVNVILYIFCPAQSFSSQAYHCQYFEAAHMALQVVRNRDILNFLVFGPVFAMFKTLD